MNIPMRPYCRHLLLVTTAFFVFFGAAVQAQAAFDPTYGADSAVALPDVEVLYPQKTRAAPTKKTYISPLAPVSMPEKPLYPARVANVGSPANNAQPVAEVVARYQPEAAVIAPTPVITPIVANAAPAAPSVMGDTKLFIAPAPVFAAAAPQAAVASNTAIASAVMTEPPALAPAPVVSSAPAIAASPEVAAATTALATQNGAAPAVNLPESTGAIAAAPAFVAPTPLMGRPSPVAAPKVVAAASAPEAKADALSTQSKSILAHIPSQIDTTKNKSQKISLERVSPETKDAFAKNKEQKDETYTAAGLSIKVRRPGLDTGFELNRAYTMLMGGETQSAVDVYKNILGSEPSNQEALFGLAATYHRLGELDKARPLYGALLKLNPNHREALNNFLVLVSDESPQEALAELERLEQRNPDFSPIPAQQAILMDKLGYTNDARAKMLRAIELSPENLTYKYNLAIMLDRQGNYADASALYRLLIDAALKGEKIPSSLDTLQKRLNFITTASTTVPANGV